MIYKFKCKATGDLVMLAPDGDRLLRLLGREPALRGIVEPAAMPAALATLHGAIAASEAARADDAAPSAQEVPDDADAVSLRRRLWPMIEMLRRAAAASEPIVWGV